MYIPVQRHHQRPRKMQDIRTDYVLIGPLQGGRASDDLTISILCVYVVETTAKSGDTGEEPCTHIAPFVDRSVRAHAPLLNRKRQSSTELDIETCVRRARQSKTETIMLRTSTISPFSGSLSAVRRYALCSLSTKPVPGTGSVFLHI